MKDAQIKPIQSLNAFWRRIDGGSYAALPLFFPRPLLLCAALIAGISISTTSAQQQEDTNKFPSDEKRIDLLFDRIMKNLPDAEQSKVDSAGSIQSRGNGPTHGTVSPAMRERELQKETAAKRVEDLPPELRAQVERTINSMESRREERKAQFRETTREQRH